MYTIIYNSVSLFKYCDQLFNFEEVIIYFFSMFITFPFFLKK